MRDISSKERIKLAFSHKEADRVAIHEAPWPTTVERWRKEGLPNDVSPAEYFEYEIMTYSPDTSLQFPQEIYEETEEYVVQVHPNGGLRKTWKHKASTPEMIDFKIKNKRDWEEHRHRMKMNDTRINWDELRRIQSEAERKGKYFVLGSGMGYDKTQGIIGSEKLLMAMVEEPEWVSDMFMLTGDIIIEVAEEILGKGIKFDGTFFPDDMGYRNATLFSSKMYRELLFPMHKKVCDFFKARGIDIILHSCGCVKDFIPQLIEAGFTCLNPLEVKAGMDIIQLKKDYGSVLSFMGGIDARKMSHTDPSVIEEEIRHKVSFAKKGGGYVFHSDHSIPDDVSFEQYKNVIRLAKKYGEY